RFSPRITRSSACRRRRTSISTKPWWTTRLRGFANRKRRRRINHSFCISQRVQLMHPTMRRRNGATTLRPSSMTAGPRCVRRRYDFSDSGASMEGTENWTFNEMTTLNCVPLTSDQHLKSIKAYGGLDKWGGPHMAPHYAAAWAWAGNTPFKWGKQVASHLGGIRNPMVISWPKRIKDKGGLRSQFTHCTDIAPTILEAAGLPEPKQVNGVAQMPMHGVSFLST